MIAGATTAGLKSQVAADIKHNPETWRYRLARWLLDGEVEAVSLLPLRPIYARDRLVVKLGEPGALNTVEVYTPLTSWSAEDNEVVARQDPWKLLLPVEVLDDLYPNTLVLIEIKGTDGRVYPQFGYFRGWTTENRQRFILMELRNGEAWQWPKKDVKQAYYAPAGFQIEWLEGRPVGGSA